MDSSDFFGLIFMAIIASPFAWVWFKSWNQETGSVAIFINWEMKNGLHMARELGYQVKSKLKSDNNARTEIREYWQSCSTLGLPEVLDITCEYYGNAGPR